jgi:hypothetical protein
MCIFIHKTSDYIISTHTQNLSKSTFLVFPISEVKVIVNLFQLSMVKNRLEVLYLFVGLFIYLFIFGKCIKHWQRLKRPGSIVLPYCFKMRKSMKSLVIKFLLKSVNKYPDKSTVILFKVSSS